MPDGHLNFCKLCVSKKRKTYYQNNRQRIKKTQRDRYWRDPEKSRSYQRIMSQRYADRQKAYRQSDRGREVQRRAQAKERIVRPREMKARQAVSNAVRDGRLKVPAACECCGNTAELQAHHHRGYDVKHRLDVIWLCARCHRKADRELKNEVA